jgi:DNA-binding transcriptional regulator YhcF (GntR family)
MEFQDNKAIYLQIAEWICEKIILRQWPPGERIPSVRELAVDLEVNPNTVARTVEFLQNEGMVYLRRGIGLFVADGAVEAATAYLRREFIGKDLPRVFRSMSLLGITAEEFLQGYKAFHHQSN